jgi:hypothetical protein
VDETFDHRSATVARCRRHRAMPGRANAGPVKRRCS